MKERPTHITLTEVTHWGGQTGPKRPLLLAVSTIRQVVPVPPETVAGTAGVRSFASTTVRKDGSVGVTETVEQIAALIRGEPWPEPLPPEVQAAADALEKAHEDAKNAALQVFHGSDFVDEMAQGLNLTLVPQLKWLQAWFDSTGVPEALRAWTEASEAFMQASTKH